MTRYGSNGNYGQVPPVEREHISALSSFIEGITNKPMKEELLRIDLARMRPDERALLDDLVGLNWRELQIELTAARDAASLEQERIETIVAHSKDECLQLQTELADAVASEHKQQERIETISARSKDHHLEMQMELSARHDAASLNHEQLEAVLAYSKDQCLVLQTELVDASAREHEQLEAILSRSKYQRLELQAERDRAQEDLQLRRIEIIAKEEEFQDLQDADDALQAELVIKHVVGLTVDHDDAAREREQLEDQYLELQLQYDAASLKQEQCLELQSERDRAQENLQMEMIDKAQKFQDKYEQLEALLVRSEDKYLELQIELSARRDSASLEHEQLEAVLAHSKDQRLELQTAEHEHEQLEAILVSLNDQRLELLAERDRAQEDLRIEMIEKEQEFQDAKDELQVELMVGHVVGLTADHDDAERESEQLEAIISHHEDRCLELRLELEAQRVAASLEQEQLEANLAQSQNQRLEMQTGCEQLETELAYLQKSWASARNQHEEVVAQMNRKVVQIQKDLDAGTQMLPVGLSRVSVTIAHHVKLCISTETELQSVRGVLTERNGQVTTSKWEKLPQCAVFPGMRLISVESLGSTSTANEFNDGNGLQVASLQTGQTLEFQIIEDEDHSELEGMVQIVFSELLEKAGACVNPKDIMLDSINKGRAKYVIRLRSSSVQAVASAVKWALNNTFLEAEHDAEDAIAKAKTEEQAAMDPEDTAAVKARLIAEGCGLKSNSMAPQFDEEGSDSVPSATAAEDTDGPEALPRQFENGGSHAVPPLSPDLGLMLEQAAQLLKWNDEQIKNKQVVLLCHFRNVSEQSQDAISVEADWPVDQVKKNLRKKYPKYENLFKHEEGKEGNEFLDEFLGAVNESANTHCNALGELRREGLWRLQDGEAQFSLKGMLEAKEKCHGFHERVQNLFEKMGVDTTDWEGVQELILKALDMNESEAEEEALELLKECYYREDVSMLLEMMTLNLYSAQVQSEAIKALKCMHLHCAEQIRKTYHAGAEHVLRSVISVHEDYELKDLANECLKIIVEFEAQDVLEAQQIQENLSSGLHNANIKLMSEAEELKQVRIEAEQRESEIKREHSEIKRQHSKQRRELMSKVEEREQQQATSREIDFLAESDRVPPGQTLCPDPPEQIPVLPVTLRKSSSDAEEREHLQLEARQMQESLSSSLSKLKSEAEEREQLRSEARQMQDSLRKFKSEAEERERLQLEVRQMQEKLASRPEGGSGCCSVQ